MSYTRGELTLTLRIDIGGGVVSLVCNSLYDLNQSLRGQLTPQQEKEIFDNVVDALTWRGWSVDFVTDRS